jgi:RND family efflux transporter MFP subunit
MSRVTLSIVLISSFAFFSCEQKKQPPPQPTPVNLDTVKAVRVFYYDKYPSTTQALMQVNLYPQVQGYITSILVKDGAHVKKGQVLYEIDKRLYQAAVDQAKANLDVAHGTTVQANEDEQRYDYLNKYKAVAKQLYDHAVITLQNSKNSEQAASEGVKTAQTNLSYSVIKAPFDGTVGISQVRLGNMVSVGSTILNTISTDDPMAVDFLINEKQLSQFDDFLKAGKNVPDSLFTILMPDNKLYPYPGKISLIDRAVDQQTGAIRVRLIFPNADYTLRVGMSTIVRVHNQEQTPQLVIPNRAVVEQMGEYFVFVDKDTLLAPHEANANAKEGSKEKKKEAAKEQKVPAHLAMEQKIILGQTIGPNVIVKEGIKEGDRIVVDGVQLLHDGSRIATGKRSPSDTSNDSHMQGTTIQSNKKN